MPYATAQDVIDCCSWPGFGQLSVTAQARLLSAASAIVDEVTGRSRYGLARRSITQTFDGGDSELWLALRPVVSIESVTVDGEAIDNTSGEEWSFDAEDGWLIRGTGRGELRFGRRWRPGNDNIVVSYTGGYTTIPDDIVVATAWLCRYLYDQGKISGAYSQETIGRYTRSIRQVALVAGVPAHVMGILQKYTPDDVIA